mmetsp:Transcript_47971/g.71068  ORF Transcript_47971/g.71068 Transcript_47971/m.71068 type:complete len:163 (-) Transcript_47971:15-503(-)|eukprot:CAMPEP_0195515048 /NCGR_PEP_ID=MMETSP0794_2-20130614/6253_1 /TAXON_ID=515487 /ORGANISM="Stephanopyxis turris, Strain CCMP 815" /LENGTH=162 /DNA_ID=CAMNT_0040643427 /DNA_START=124 /DNA_END=612 /DNA_ORIENTATION=+
MSKAVYNNPKVRLGNWSEDQFGAELAAQPRQQAKSKSVAQESYPRHSTQAYVNKATPSGTRDSGASFAEMFGHRGAASGADHFRTSDPISGGKRVSGAGRKRAKKINSESTSPYASQKTIAEAQFNKAAARTLRATGKSVVASRDTSNARKASFTKQFGGKS